MASRALSVLYLLAVAVAPRLTAGYSFDIAAPPTQCGPLNLVITGGSGKPPYTALIVPYGAAPKNPEQRKVFQHQFSGSSTTFALPYPANSNFVVTVGDSTGIGTGGTSIPTTVGGSSNTSCLPGSVAAEFSFQLIPQSISQCSPTTLAWINQQDPVSIFLVIPGGQSENIPITGLGNQIGGTMGFNWTANVPAQTNVILVANDNRGVGTGGSVNIIVSFSTSQDSSCLSGSSPSSTAGDPAGAVQTDSGGGGGGSSGGGGGGGSGGGGNDSGGGGGSTNIGAIVGGVVGGIAAIAIAGLLVLFWRRRRQRARHPAAHGVDLLPEGAARDPDHPPELYTPEPFIVPPHSHAGADENGGTSAGRPSMSEMGRRYSALSTTDPSESTFGAGLFGAGAPSGSASNAQSSSRKSPSGAPQLRPVNFVQHEDAGEMPEQSGSAQPAETIELPPSYTSVRPPKET